MSFGESQITEIAIRFTNLLDSILQLQITEIAIRLTNSLDSIL
jgi:hypothetical protein